MPNGYQVMNDEKPSGVVLARRTVFECPWFSLRGKEVQTRFAKEEFFVLDCSDFVCACARTEAGLFPLVRQYRPSVEECTWELPAGTVDAEEDPIRAIERELYEETGHRATRTEALGSYAVDFGRFSNRVHCFFIEVSDRVPTFTEELGIHCELFSANQIDAMVNNGQLACIQHVAVWMFARSKGLIPPSRGY